MWKYIVRHILRNRLGNLIAILLLTGFFAWKAELTQSYEFIQMLPDSDSTFIVYNEFKETFGQDGNALFVGIKSPKLFTTEVYNEWHKLTEEIRQLEGVDEVLSISRLFRLEKNEENRKFDFKLLKDGEVKSQTELDSLKQEIYALKFYDDLLINFSSGATYMAITIGKDVINHKNRDLVIEKIEESVISFSKRNQIQTYISGLPFIRTKTTLKLKNELQIFTLLALLIASIALFIFFRSFKAVMFPLLIVVISVIWCVGILSLMGYEITILTGILPPLIIIIGVENCIFLLNKYHYEYRIHGNKVKALARVVHRTGKATLLTNLTTAVGFAAFIITRNNLLVEFGIIASLSIMMVFLLCIFLIPIFFSYLDPPGKRHLKHMDNKFTTGLINKIINIVLNHRRYVYAFSILFLVAGIAGISLLKTTGHVVDDISKKDPLYQDLKFFESEFRGILPFEIYIDTYKKRGVMSQACLSRINTLEDTLRNYSEFSKPLSVVSVVKFARQAFYNGNPDYYDMPTARDRAFIFSYVPETEDANRGILNAYMDTAMQKTRISVQMANIGTQDILRLRDELQPKIDSIFDPETYKVHLTGTSIVFVKGSNYLIKNLLYSLLLAITVITLLMALLFSSYKMIGISLIPNLLPQILTAALMGYFAISIKPSTILIFSIALGISVDNTIHFLSRYRTQLKLTNWNIKESVISALSETGYSMVYSSIVLFFGFSIFTLSSFGGTEALGYLISFTLIAAVCSNLLLLPSLLLWLDSRITTKRFEEPLLVIFDEEEEFDIDELVIEKKNTGQEE